MADLEYNHNVRIRALEFATRCRSPVKPEITSEELIDAARKIETYIHGGEAETNG